MKKFFVEYLDDNKKVHLTVVNGANTLKFYFERFDILSYETI